MLVFRVFLALLLALACGASSAVPFRINTSQHLSFGSFVAGTGGTVSVSTAGLRSKTGGVSLISSSSGQAATFLVTGNQNTTYTISLPSQATLSNGSGQTMTITDFFSSPSDTSASTGLINGGSQTLYVGATLSVGANQASGSYSGSFTVIVNNP